MMHAPVILWSAEKPSDFGKHVVQAFPKVHGEAGSRRRQLPGALQDLHFFFVELPAQAGHRGD